MAGFLGSTSIADIPDQELLEDGQHTFQVQSAELKEAEKGGEYLQVILRPINTPNADDIFDRLMLPRPGDDARTRRFFELRLKGFNGAFGVDLDSMDSPSQLVGAQGDALVRTDQYQGVDRNEIAKYVI